MNWYKFANLSLQEAQEILGLSSPYSKKDLNKKYRKLIRHWHPDINKSPQAEEKARDINRAYQLLSSLQNIGQREQQTTTPSDVDVPDFMQEDVTVKDIQDYFSQYVYRFLQDFVFGNFYYANEPKEIAFWPTKTWMSLEWFNKYIEALLKAWKINIGDQGVDISSKFKQDFFKEAIFLYQQGLSLRDIQGILKDYIMDNYKTKGTWEKTKDWWNSRKK